MVHYMVVDQMIKVGAHTYWATISKSLGVSMIANCSKIREPTESSPSEDYATQTTTQKDTLEWTLLWVIIRDWGLFKMGDNKSLIVIIQMTVKFRCHSYKSNEN